MKVTLDQHTNLVRYFSFTEYFRTLPEAISRPRSRTVIQKESVEAYQNDAVLHGRVNIAVDAVVQIMEADQ